jgi:hypothetical protein
MRASNMCPSTRVLLSTDAEIDFYVFLASAGNEHGTNVQLSNFSRLPSCIVFKLKEVELYALVSL